MIDGFVYNYGSELLLTCFSVITYLACRSDSAKTADIFCFYCLHIIYVILSSVLLTDSSFIQYAMEYCFSACFFSWLCLRTQIPSNKNPDRNNVLFAFYKGKRGSLLMNVFSLFGLPVKSLCILADGQCLRLKSKTHHFVLQDRYDSVIKSNDYVIYDTGIKATPEFLQKMSKFTNKKAYLFGLKFLRVNCIYAISDLLSSVDCKYKAKTCFDFIPSIYLRKCIKIGG